MKRLSLIALASSAVLMSNVYADNLKVGIVNIDMIVQQSPLAISFNQKISAEFKPRQDALNAAQKKLQDELDQLNYTSFKLTPEERSKLQATIATDRREFDVMNTSLQKDLSTTQNQYTQALMAKLNAVIAKIAQDSHYDMIQTSANILYMNNTVDLTPQVIQQLK